MARTSMAKGRQAGGDETQVRERILEAAFAAFMKSGYATTSMLEIATRARVSKRELYALVGNKQEMLIACISERAKRLDAPADLPVLRDRDTLAQVLASFGMKLVREISDSHGHCGIPTGDRRAGPGARSGGCARPYRTRDQPRRLA